MKEFKLGKIHKLCGVKAIDALFSDRGAPSALAYPLRAVWKDSSRQESPVSRFLVSVPKKRLHKAVERVQMRRRVREAYRLNHALYDSQAPAKDIVFVYVSDKERNYAQVEHAMHKLLCKIYNNQPIERDHQ